MQEDSRYFSGRDHTEAEVAEVFADFSTDGVYQHPTEKLVVTAPGGMVVNVGPGRAIVQGFWYRLASVKGIAIPSNGSGQERYDRIVLRLDRGAAHKVSLYLRSGVPGAGVPGLERAIGGSWEISLASVRVSPGVTGVLPGDLWDERGYLNVCGWAGGKGTLGAETVNGIDGLPGFVSISAADSNTGFQSFPQDRFDIVAGQKQVAVWQPTAVTIGAHDASITLRSGGNIAVPRERIYIDNTYIMIGRDGAGGPGSGPSQIHIGTSTANASIYIGQSTSPTNFSNISIGGALHLTSAAVNTTHYVNVPEGFSTEVQFRNTPSNTKFFRIVFGTAASQGLGGSGDASLFTQGVAAGRVILGTEGVARLMVGSGYMTFGAQGVRSTGFNFQQKAETPQEGMRLYHSNQGHVVNWWTDTAGCLIFGINNAPWMWIDPVSNGFTFGGGGTRGNGFSFQQAANTPRHGLRVFHTNTGNHLNVHMDDSGRAVLSLGEVPQTWWTGGSASFGGSGPRPSGFNYQQTADQSGYGLRVWHSSQTNHIDYYVDPQVRAVISINNIARIFVSPNGWVTIGPTATDTAMLHIDATQGGNTAASGIRLTNMTGVVTPGVANLWVRGDGVAILASNTSQLWIHPGTTRAITPHDNGGTSLGLAAQRWGSVYGVTGSFSGDVSGVNGVFTNVQTGLINGAPIAGGGTDNVVATTVYPPGNNQGNIGTVSLIWHQMYTDIAYKSGGGDWGSISDLRVKEPESIRPYNDGIALIMQLAPVRYRYNGEYSMPAGRECVGFIAQDLEKVVPEMVSLMPIPKNADSEPEDMRVVDTTPLIFMLLNGLKEHEERLRALERSA